jgi:hypothetical protein
MSSSFESAWIISEHYNWTKPQMLENKVGFTSKVSPSRSINGWGIKKGEKIFKDFFNLFFTNNIYMK